MKTAELPFVLMSNDEGRYVHLDNLQNVDDEWQITEGLSRAKDFPPSARFPMSKRHRKQLELSDCLDNVEGQFVVSERLKAFVESNDVKKVEFLKVAVINHKGKAIPESYYIMNPLGFVNCIDKDKSKLLWNTIDPDCISGILKLVLKPEAMDPNLQLFRAKHWDDRVLINRRLAARIEAAGFTGMAFMEPSEFVG